MSSTTENTPKVEEWLLESIALVRSRKSRPDLDRIAKAMQKNYAVDPNWTAKLLAEAVKKGTVAQTNFKGAISYRIAFTGGKPPATKVRKGGSRSVRLCKRISKAITELDRNDNGVGFESIERFIASRWSTTSSVLTSKIRLRSALRDGVANNLFIKTPEKTYKLAKGTQQNTTCDEQLEEDDEDDSDIQCDFCQHGADRNQAGLPEELLICKDCGNQAHPSCLGYSAELVEQIRIDDSWQCIDCKSCVICDGTGDPDTLLFCDACDKGYHMLCHTPKLNQMPSGKWVCSLCSHKEQRVSMGEETEVLIIDDEEMAQSTGNNQSLLDKYRISSNAAPTMVVLPREPVSINSSTSAFLSSPLAISPNGISSNTHGKTIALTPFPQRLHQSSSVTLTSSVQTRPTRVVPHRNGLSDKAATTPKSSMHVKRSNHRAAGVSSSTAEKVYHKATAQHLSRDRKSTITDDVLSKLPQDVADWLVADVVYYLRAHGFLQESKLFEDQEIDGKALLLMSRNDVLTGLQLKVGPALKIYHIHVSKLQSRTDFVGL